MVGLTASNVHCFAYGMRGEKRRRVVEDVVNLPCHELGRDSAGALEIADQDPAQDQVDAGTRRHELPFRKQALGHLGADRAQAEKADIQFHSRILSCRGHSPPRG